MIRVYRDLAPYLLKHRSQYIIGGLAVVATALFMVVTPRILAFAIDGLQTGQATRQSLVWYALFIVGAALTAAAFGLLQRRQMVVASRQIEAELRDDLFRHLLTLDRGFYERARVGDLMNRLASDLLAVRELVGPGLNMGSRQILICLFALTAMLLIQPLLGLLVLATVPIMVVVVTYLKYLVGQRFRAAQGKLSEIAAKAQENFSGARIVRGYAIEDRELLEFKAMNDDYVRLNMSLAHAEAPMTAIMGLMMTAASLIILLYGGRLVIFGGGLTVGTYVAFTTYLAMLAAPVVAIGRLITIYQRGITSWARLKELLEARPEVVDVSHTGQAGQAPAGDPAGDLAGDIVLRKVGLRRNEVRLLTDINLHIPQGSSLGVTGRTGSGKSLVASLLTREYDPTEGVITIGGRDLRDIPLAALREMIGMVAQEPFLFSESIAENIAFGLSESRALGGLQQPDLERVRYAAAIADLERDVSAFPMQFDTMLGERGVTLSGGQRQRTAMARAIARRPALLILDDALSAVDTETESRILAGLREVLAGRTVILISHRVSTLRQADNIVVLDGGQIVEEGTHEVLLARGGAYAELERLQRLSHGPPADPAHSHPGVRS